MSHVIVSGAGWSGLSLTLYLLRSTDLTITLIDPVLAPAPGRTWCFWGPLDPAIQPFVSRTWHHVFVGENGRGTVGSLSRNPYHMVRGSDFAGPILKQLDDHPRVRVLKAKVEAAKQVGEQVCVETSAGIFHADFLFASHLRPKRRPRLVQHFAGWEVTAVRPLFDPETVGLMDFVPSQDPSSTAFFYSLPITSTRALIESTRISPRPDPVASHERALAAFLSTAGAREWEIHRREQGVLPMDADLDRGSGPVLDRRIIPIGRAAGLTKPSTGYTAASTLRYNRALVDSLRDDGWPSPPAPKSSRFRWYDALFLDVLQREPGRGSALFRQILTPDPWGSMDAVLDFLSEQSSLLTEATLFARLPWGTFLSAALRRSHVGWKADSGDRRLLSSPKYIAERPE